MLLRNILERKNYVQKEESAIALALYLSTGCGDFGGGHDAITRVRGWV